MAHVVLAMSGGVDSSVAAWLLREAGHEVIGVFMRHGIQALGARADGVRPAGHKKGCCTAADAADARRVAHLLGIPFYAINFEAEFVRIVDYFVDEYASGRTPNPCVMCNNWVKFGKLFHYADRIGAEYVATGHYARVLPAGDGHEPALCRGRDPSKDQSYVLFGIERRLLRRLLFPVGDHRKEEIRRIAAKLGLRVAEKRDSQEICFIPDQDHARFVRRRRAVDGAGEIVTTDGTVVGRHDGIERFTVGQRKGLGIALGQPRFVVRLEPQTRRVVIGTKDELARRELTAAGANWLTTKLLPADAVVQKARMRSVESGHGRRSSPGACCQVKIRYRSPPVDASVEVLSEDRFRVVFNEACFGVAPGQAAVCYDGDRVLGGGWIE